MQLTFFSPKDAEEERVMNSRRGNMKFLSYNHVTEVVDERFDSFPSRYQDNLNKSIRESALFFIQFK